VASVAWVTERKDVLYSLFFLGSLLCYVYYTKKERARVYFLSLLFFVLSLLSKGMGVVLPFVLLLLDWFMYFKINRRVLINKIPHFLLAAVFVVIAFVAREHVVITHRSYYDFPANILIGCHGLLFYVAKTAVPIRLSAVHPLPWSNGQTLPLIFQIAPVVVLGLTVLIAFSRRCTRRIIFGSLFYLITVIIVLGFVPLAGDVLGAERFTYLASVGLMYLVGEGIYWVYQKLRKRSKVLKNVQLIIFLGLLCVLSFLTWQRCKVWKNSFTLWDDVIKKYPNVARAYLHRGNYYYWKDDYRAAIEDFSQALKLNHNALFMVYFNRAGAYRAIGQFDKAIADYTMVIDLAPYGEWDVAQAFTRRGNLYFVKGEHLKAVEDYGHAVEINPHSLEAYFNRGVTYFVLNEYEKAIADYTHALSIDPNNVRAYKNRARSYLLAKDYEKAWEDVKQLERLGSEVDADLLEELRAKQDE
jgi:tetratricopeptide (TPR) repeat protein